jgi:hypothetical protein
MRKALGSLALVVFALGCGGASPPVEHASSDGTYEIHLVRHPPVGASYHMLATHTSTSTTLTRVTNMGDETEQEVTTITLDARYTVLALGPAGVPSRLRAEVRQFTVETANGITSPPIPAVLVMTADAPTTGENGETIPDETLALLGEMPGVASASATQDGDDDAVFGTRTPQAVGGSWPIDSSFMARDLGQAGLVASPNSIRGHTDLVRTVTEGGQPCLVVHSESTIGPFTMEGLPEGAEVQQAESTFEGDLTLPLDVQLPAVHDHSRLTIDLRLTFPTDMGPGSLELHSSDEDRRDLTLD